MVIANGYTLSLEDFNTQEMTFKTSLFYGTVTDYQHATTPGYTLPQVGQQGIIVIFNTGDQVTHVHDICAGSLSDVGAGGVLYAE